jgi:GT2 family glycosyltransferase
LIINKVTDKLIKIASLTCSYNRKEKTTSFLTSLLAQPLPNGYKLDVYLLDDKSSDGTADYVRTNFPAVNVIDGTGSLYWAGGMRKVWGEASKKGDYDFFLLLNDDVTLANDSIIKLIDAYNRSEAAENVILGAVMDMGKTKMTYGGYKLINKMNGDVEPVVPDEKELKECEVGNANIMLVDKNTFSKIGGLSEAYTHGLADFDYTLTAVENGGKVWVAPGYFGYCDNDHGKPWLSSKQPLKKRIQYLYSPTGLAYKEYLVFQKKHFPYSVPGKIVKLWLKTLVPAFYDKFKKV